jgi:hypothetical protein
VVYRLSRGPLIPFLSWIGAHGSVNFDLSDSQNRARRQSGVVDENPSIGTHSDAVPDRMMLLSEINGSDRCADASDMANMAIIRKNPIPRRSRCMVLPANLTATGIQNRARQLFSVKVHSAGQDCAVPP